MKKIACYALSVALLLSACSKDDNNKPEDNSPEGNTTLEIQVYNATNWSPSAPAGTLAAGITVQLFKSRAAFNSNTVAYTQTTDANGKATFTKIDGGEYFIVAKGEGIDNLLGATLKDGVYVGWKSDSLYQTTGEISSSPTNSFAALGNFRPDDLNGDMIINDNDKTALPAQSVTATINATATRRILIGRADNRPYPQFGTKAQLQQVMQSSIVSLDKWHQLQVAIDAVYTDEFACTAQPGTPALGSEWCTLNGYVNVTSADPIVEKFWKDGFAIVTQLNRIITYVPNMTSADMTAADKKLAVAQAQGMKAYVYQNLFLYFAGLPLLDEITFPPTAQRASTENTRAYIDVLLAEAIADLGTDKSIISAAACKAMQIRAALMEFDYAKTVTIASAILNDGSYHLASMNELSNNPANAEILWNTSTTLADPLRSIYNKGSFVPELRLTEVIFAFAEANAMMDNLTAAAAALNQLRDREGIDDVAYSDNIELLLLLVSDWKRNMFLEGNRYYALAHWGRTQDILQPYGFGQKNFQLPIPASVLVDYPNIVQNPMY